MVSLDGQLRLSCRAPDLREIRELVTCLEPVEVEAEHVGESLDLQRVAYVAPGSLTCREVESKKEPREKVSFT